MRKEASRRGAAGAVARAIATMVPPAACAMSSQYCAPLSRLPKVSFGPTEQGELPRQLQVPRVLVVPLAQSGK